MKFKSLKQLAQQAEEEGEDDMDDEGQGDGGSEEEDVELDAISKKMAAKYVPTMKFKSLKSLAQ